MMHKIGSSILLSLAVIFITLMFTALGEDKRGRTSGPVATTSPTTVPALGRHIGRDTYLIPKSTVGVTTSGQVGIRVGQTNMYIVPGKPGLHVGF